MGGASSHCAKAGSLTSPAGSNSTDRLSHAAACAIGRNGSMAISDWYQVKLFLEHACGVSMDALHVIAGFIIFMLAGMFSKRGLASPLPLLALLLPEVANEAYDLHVERWPEPS